MCFENPDDFFSFSGNSKIQSGGEGMFAKRDLDEGSIISVYGGFVVKYSKEQLLWNHTCDNRFKNLLQLNVTHYLDLPAPPYDDISVYRASLGHKINHSFKPNTKYVDCKSIRF